MARFWIGASGWHYNHWKGRFYPQELSTREWLSFYRQPRASTWDLWHKTAALGPQEIQKKRA